jgi:hypothetical protein
MMMGQIAYLDAYGRLPPKDNLAGVQAHRDQTPLMEVTRGDADDRADRLRRTHQRAIMREQVRVADGPIAQLWVRAVSEEDPLVILGAHLDPRVPPQCWGGGMLAGDGRGGGAEEHREAECTYRRVSHGIPPAFVLVLQLPFHDKTSKIPQIADSISPFAPSIPHFLNFKLPVE